MGMLGTWVPATQQPNGRGNLVATSSSVNQVKLSRTALSAIPAVTTYEVERQDPGSTRCVHLTTTSTTNYTEAGLAEASSYNYRVLVKNAKRSLKEYSGVASVTTASRTIVPLGSR